MSHPDEPDELFRVALHEHADTLLADVHASPGRMLDGIRRRQRRRNRLTAAAGGVAVAVAIAGAVVLVRPTSGNSGQPLATSTSHTAVVSTSAPTASQQAPDYAVFVTVPDVRGVGEELARRMLASQQLEAEVVGNGSLGPQVVLAQSPAPGSMASLHTRVRLSVGAPDPTATSTPAVSPSGSPTPLPASASGASFGPAPAGTCAVAPTAKAAAGNETFLALTGCGIEAYDESGTFYGYLQGDGAGTSAQAAEMATSDRGDLYLFREDSKGLLGRSLYRWANGVAVRIGGDLGAVSAAAPTSGRLVPLHLTAAGPYVAWSRDVAADPEVTVDIQVLDTRTGKTRTIPVSTEPFGHGSTAVTGLDLRMDGQLAAAVQDSRGIVDSNATPTVELRVIPAGASAMPAKGVQAGKGCYFGRGLVWQVDAIAATQVCGHAAATAVVADPTSLAIVAVGVEAADLPSARRSGGFYALPSGDAGEPVVVAGDDEGRTVATVSIGQRAGTGDSAFVSDVAAWGFAIG